MGEMTLYAGNPVLPEPVSGTFPRVQILAQNQEGIKFLKVPLINNRAGIAPHPVIAILGGRLRIYPEEIAFLRPYPVAPVDEPFYIRLKLLSAVNVGKHIQSCEKMGGESIEIKVRLLFGVEFDLDGGEKISLSI